MFSELLDLQNQIWYGEASSWSRVWKDWFAVFKVKVTAKASVIKMWLLMLWTADPFAAKHDHSWCVLWRDWIAVFKVRGLICVLTVTVTAKGKTFQWMFNQMIFSELPNLFATKLIIAMHHHELKCHSKRLFPVFTVKVTVKVTVTRSQSQPWLSTISYLLHFWPFGNQTVLWYISHTLPSEDLSPFLEGGCCYAQGLSWLKIDSM